MFLLSLQDLCCWAGGKRAKVERFLYSVGREVNQRKFADLVVSVATRRTQSRSLDLSSVSVDQPEVWLRLGRPAPPPTLLLGVSSVDQGGVNRREGFRGRFSRVIVELMETESDMRETVSSVSSARSRLRALVFCSAVGGLGESLKDIAGGGESDK